MSPHGFRGRLNDALEVIKPIGWLVLGIGLGAGLLAAFTQWRELAVLAFACLILLVLAVPFLLGRTAVSVDLRLQPERVAAGESVAAGVVVVNRASTRLVPTTLEVPVGSSTHRYGISSLASGGTHEESFTIRTERRGVNAGELRPRRLPNRRQPHAGVPVDRHRHRFPRHRVSDQRWPHHPRLPQHRPDRALRDG